jgi:hypothetical protein
VFLETVFLFFQTASLTVISKKSISP